MEETKLSDLLDFLWKRQLTAPLEVRAPLCAGLQLWVSINLGEV
jgi:hypothetical protein